MSDTETSLIDKIYTYEIPHVTRAVKAMRARAGQIPIFISIPSHVAPQTAGAPVNASVTAQTTAAKLDAFHEGGN